MKGDETSALASVEKRAQEFWDREQVPRKALALNPDGPTFRFTEGPPTANGRPHLGHMLSRALKDVVLRHRRMRGFRVISSMAGWDCQGLPVEVEVEKSHGWKSKRQIIEYGVAKFNDECRKSVFTYEMAWREMSRMLGYWLDYDHPYFTMDRRYIESVWWSLKSLYGRGYLEKGRYVIPYCPRCETPVSMHEVAQGYRETSDPSVTLRLRIVPDPKRDFSGYFLVWTTTPWTLPSNLALAVNPEMNYVVFKGEDGAQYIMSEDALPRYFTSPGKVPQITRRLNGGELVGLMYEPPFAEVTPKAEGRHSVYPATFVSKEEGTGIVHIAPSYGADDYTLGQQFNLGYFDPLDSSGHFTSEVPDVVGVGFKAADPKLTEILREREVLWKEEKVLHTYPFCWRCNNPLIYRALETWFVRTHKVREKLMSNNSTVTWIPSHLRDGRFGNFLSEGKDWALSRNRYWGTPLPIWSCPEGHTMAVGSFEELAKLSGAPLPDSFDPHKPYIDSIVLKCPQHGSPMVREVYVIDCWYDSGSAPFAQFHYPFEGKDMFDPASPLDYIAEGLDQTRGWFYTTLVLATILFDRPAYKNVLVNGMVLDKEGQKMSKSKGNVADPLVLMERMGADASRLATYMGPFTEPFRFSEAMVRTTGTKFITTLLNVTEFYRSNRSADHFIPSPAAPHPKGTLDRWMLSRLEGMVERVGRSLDLIDPHASAVEITQFIDELSTWYLRRSRDRFWKDGMDPDKQDAYATLSFTLTTLAKVLAPLTPHVAEQVYHMAMATEFAEGSDSVHLQTWPEVQGYRDVALEDAMKRVMVLVEAGRNLRTKAGVKSRIPLPELVVSNISEEDMNALGSSFHELVTEELNVKRLTLLPPEEFAIRPFPEVDWAMRSTDDKINLALFRRPSRELLLEGLSREIIRRIQMTRKEEDLDYTDTVNVELYLGPTLKEALDLHKDVVMRECQITSLKSIAGLPDDTAQGLRKWEDVGGEQMALKLQWAASNNQKPPGGK
jgi:isoleucyl-tRNA synthetase